MRGDQLIREGRRPAVFLGNNFVKNLLGVAEKIVVEIAAADDVIALFILLLHIAEHLIQLLLMQIAVGTVGGQVGVEDHQLSAVLRRNAVDRITAVEVKQL